MKFIIIYTIGLALYGIILNFVAWRRKMGGADYIRTVKAPRLPLPLNLNTGKMHIKDGINGMAYFFHQR